MEYQGTDGILIQIKAVCPSDDNWATLRKVFQISHRKGHYFTAIIVRIQTDFHKNKNKGQYSYNNSKS